MTHCVPRSRSGSDDFLQTKPFLAWLFNASPVKDVVVINDRWGIQKLMDFVLKMMDFVSKMMDFVSKTMETPDRDRAAHRDGANEAGMFYLK